jgi:hypothetical protein
MTDAAVHLPATAARCERCPRRLGCAIYQTLIAHWTRRALDQLPDDLLRDVGVTRGEIPFVSDVVASGRGDPTRDAFHPLNRSAAEQAPA